MPLPGFDSGSRYCCGYDVLSHIHGFPMTSLVTPQRPEAETAYLTQLVQLLKPSNDAHRNESQPLTKLHEKLFIGGILNERSVALLQSHGVTDIVNVVEQQHPTPSSVRECFQVHSLRTEDVRDYYIIENNYGEFKRILDSIYARGGSIYVHCYAGINRSVALCIAYLLEQYDWDLLDVVEHFHKCGRHYVLDNEGFQRQLVEFFLKLQDTKSANIQPPLDY